MNDFKWSQKEKLISRSAYNKAYENECSDIIKTVKQKADRISNPKGIRELEDFLYKKRKEIDGTITGIPRSYPYSVG